MNTNQIWEGLGMALAAYIGIAVILAIYKMARESGQKIISSKNNPSEKQVRSAIIRKIILWTLYSAGGAFMLGALLGLSNPPALSLWVLLFLGMIVPAICGLFGTHERTETD